MRLKVYRLHASAGMGRAYARWLFAPEMGDVFVHPSDAEGLQLLGGGQARFAVLTHHAVEHVNGLVLEGTARGRGEEAIGQVIVGNGLYLLRKVGFGHSKNSPNCMLSFP
jgi:hypothetical protein